MNKISVRDEFLDNVRSAVAWAAPVGEVDRTMTAPDRIERILHGSDLWLSTKTVEGFETSAFADLAPADREELAAAVERFLEVARDVAPDRPTSAAQRRQALPQFQTIALITRNVVLNEWASDVETLLTEARNWSLDQGWLASFREKDTSDKFLGRYRIAQLYIQIDSNTLLLDPVARYAPGTSGLLDLALIPSYESVKVTRVRQKWYIHAPRGEWNRRQWSKQSFVETAKRLSELK